MSQKGAEELMDTRTTLFIADDHSVFRRDLKDLIARSTACSLVGEAANGDLAWKGIRQSRPEIALLDISMPGMTGLELAAQIQCSPLKVKVILVTSYKEESLFNQAMDLGVQGYVLKDNYVSDVPEALSAIPRGKLYLSPSIYSFSLKRRNLQSESNDSILRLDDLTPTQLRVLRLIADDLELREIGKRLSMRSDEVASHRNHIGMKLGLQGDLEVKSFAQRSKGELVGFKLIAEDVE